MWRFAPRCLIAAFVAFSAPAHAFEVTGTKGTSVTATPLETFAKPWAMTFLPDGKALVTEKGGAIWLLAKDGRKIGQVTGQPEVRARGQGGLGDIILHPNYTSGWSTFRMLSATRRILRVVARRYSAPLCRSMQEAVASARMRSSGVKARR